jgi:hypothetical protein
MSTSLINNYINLLRHLEITFEPLCELNETPQERIKFMIRLSKWHNGEEHTKEPKSTNSYTNFFPR